ncbi:MAG: FKBP-type peptidyl-prolyl cis-trans isomerase [Saprospiraceae bacterium]|nr:FKBP-type peptidyl-prolyl cis-trans isomerase [Saprospiraceae bacterium]MBK7811330.1 FKBP-type peptidyl-prolyl cis-trans isomerase [Saprospiraceae bacterium]MBK9631420.1 FKBP-type peptidyl-prolyl cis-trans isomerase [Saprospiraceae bacterium]
MDTLSYSLGVLFGNSLKQQGVDKISPADMVEALEEVLAGKPTKISMQEASDLYSKSIAKLQEKQYEGNKSEGEKFLADNAKKPGIKTTASGLQYEVLTMGTGAKPAITDKVKTHYHGTLINGKVFDSSVDRGEPISFPLNGVIKGWTEALQLMPVGSKFRLFIPYELAYGERGAGGDIKPFSALIFEVELLAIE